MGWLKPIIKWIPKKIKGTVRIKEKFKPDGKEDKAVPIEESPYAGIRPGEPHIVPEIKPGEYFLPGVEPTDIEDIASAGETPIRNNFSEEDRGIIDEFVDGIAQLESDLDYVDAELDKKLDSLSIPYDSKKSVLLDEALHCPHCGNPSAPNVITYRDIKRNKNNKATTSNEILSMAVDPNTIGKSSAKDVVSQQERKMQELNFNVMDIIWRQVLIWVLKFVYKVLSPLSGVPFVKKIPKGIRRAYEALEAKNRFNIKPSDYGTSDAAEEEGVEGTTSEFGRDSESQNLKDVASLGELYKTGSFIHNLFCAQHNDNFEKYSYPLIQGSEYEPWLWMKDVNERQRDSVKLLKEYGGAFIPDGYRTSSGITFINKKPEEYLRARRDGNGPGASFLKGGNEVIKKVNKKYMERAKKMLKEWWDDPETLCCILRNVLGVGQIQVDSDIDKGRKILLAILGILELYRNLISWNVRDDLAKLFNLIMMLLNSIIMKLISSYANLLKSKITEKIMSADFFEKLKVGSVKCLPWAEMVAELGLYAEDLLKELLAYITSFFSELEAVNDSSYQLALKAEKALKVDKWIYIIKQILAFLKVWELCTAGPQDAAGTGVDADNLGLSDDARDELANHGGSQTPEEAYLTQEEIDQMKADGKIIPENTIQNLKKVPTIYSERGVEGIKARKPGKNLADIIKKAQTEEEKRKDEFRDQEYIDRVSKPWKIGEPGMRILLTNFIGLSESDAQKVLDNKGDNCCENILSDEELRKIRNSLLD